jgi:RNA polymerase sigma-70 factor (ECF subfamily)
MPTQSFSHEYVHRLVAGDPKVEHDFVNYFGEFLRIKLRKLRHWSQTAEDVRQETFVRVFRVLRHNGLTSPERIGAFVNGVCNNVLAEQYRRVSRLSQVAEGFEAPAKSPDPEVELMTREQEQHVHDVLAKLPPKDRQILWLVFFEEQDRDDVCRLYCVDRSHFRVLLHRAKNRFREELRRAHNAPLVI